LEIKKTGGVMKKNLHFVLLFLVFWAPSSFAGEADVVDVKVSKGGNSSYRFTVTVLHKDTGWDHYANKWDIIDGEGMVLGTRTLHHPHVEEQPFTRSLSGVEIPDNIRAVTVRAHDSVHEYGGKVVNLELP
jgi:hypothetical protein